MLAVEEACDLHRQRRAARDETAVAHHLEDGAGDGFRVHAVVGVEALVLKREQHLQVMLIDIFGIDRQPPFSFRGGEGAQKAIVAIDDRYGYGFCLFERKRVASAKAFT